jgi:hypothetical protein
LLARAETLNNGIGHSDDANANADASGSGSGSGSGGGDGGAEPPLGVVLTHISADFDTLSSAVGLAKLRNHRLGAQCTFVVLPRGKA